MTTIPIDHGSLIAALDRLIPLALSDTGQARRVADFLLAWWNGPELGKFDIAEIFALDTDVARDVTTVFGFLGQHSGAIYIDALGYGVKIQQIIARWRDVTDANAA